MTLILSPARPDDDGGTDLDEVERLIKKAGAPELHVQLNIQMTLDRHVDSAADADERIDEPRESWA